jgi:hypothetical protein
MSQIDTVRQGLITALTAALPSGVALVPVNSLEDFKLTLRQPPTVGVAYAGKRYEPRPKAIGATRQNVAAWNFEVYVAASGPAPGVAAGQDAFSLLEASDQALEGLLFVLGSQKVHVLAAGDALVDMPVGALLYVQGWQFWQQG